MGHVSHSVRSAGEECRSVGLREEGKSYDKDNEGAEDGDVLDPSPT